jgi:hypothetical protein
MKYTKKMTVAVATLAAYTIQTAVMAAPSTVGAHPDQSTVASHAAFAQVPANAIVVSKAIDAKDLAGAKKLIGLNGAFYGTVSSVYSPSDHDIVILDFDPNYRTALTAAVKPDAFAKFPPIESLKGKQVIVTGKFTAYHGHPEFDYSSALVVAAVPSWRAARRAWRSCFSFAI